jgi:hypothetical protein
VSHLSFARCSRLSLEPGEEPVHKAGVCLTADARNGGLQVVNVLVVREVLRRKAAALEVDLAVRQPRS